MLKVTLSNCTFVTFSISSYTFCDPLLKIPNELSLNEVLFDMKQKFNLNTPEAWNKLTIKQIRPYKNLLNNYSLLEIKCLGCPEGKYLFTKPNGYWDKQENIQEFINNLKNFYNLKTQKDWDLLNKKQILEFAKNNSIFKKLSMYDIRKLGFPNGNFVKISKPKTYWNNINNVNDFINQLTINYNLNSFDDWNLLTKKQIKHLGGNNLLLKYSLYDIKCMGFPEGKQLFAKPCKSSEYWNDSNNIRLFLDMLRNNLNLESIYDWNLLNKKQILFYGGSKLLLKYSIFELKSMGNPDGVLLYDKPSRYWKNKENLLNFINLLKEKLNLNTFSDWNSITINDIKKFGGIGLLKYYSLSELKSIGFPEGSFNKLSSKTSTPKANFYWDDFDNVQNFLNDFQTKFNLISPEDWNSVTAKQLISNGGSSLLNRYSIYDIKCIACPNGKYLFSKPNKPLKYWNRIENIQNFIDELKEKFNIKTANDWNRISKSQINSIGGSGLLLYYTKNNNFQNIIKNHFPDLSKILLNKEGNNYSRSSQRWLFLQVQKLFPGEEIIEDYYHSDISRESGISVQFDIFLINKNIAFEYHGQQHYGDIPSGFAPIEIYQDRDKEKLRLCKKYGIHLVVIPYWWDNSLDTLKYQIEHLLPK